MFKYIILFTFFINFNVCASSDTAAYEQDKAFYKKLIKSAIALGKELKKDANGLKEKAQSFSQDSCENSVYIYVSPRIQNNLEERKKIKALLEDCKKQNEENLQPWILLANRSHKYIQDTTSLRPDVYYLKTVELEN